MWHWNVCLPKYILFCFISIILQARQFILPMAFYFLSSSFIIFRNQNQDRHETQHDVPKPALQSPTRVETCLVLSKNKQNKSISKKCINLCSGEPDCICHTIFVLCSKGKIPLTPWWRVSTPLEKRMASHGPGQWREPRHWLRVRLHLGPWLGKRQRSFLCKVMIVLCCVVLC